jgi:hypothetical protein
MIYLLIIALASIVLMGLHIMDLHIEIKQLKECVMLISNSLDKERERVKDLEDGYPGVLYSGSNHRVMIPDIPIRFFPDLIKENEDGNG